MNTKHLSLTRGQTKSVKFVSLDDDAQKRDLTNATIYCAVRADIKIDPSIKLTSGVIAGWRTGIVISD